MKILIADDDKLIRFSLKSMLLDILPNTCYISEALNGTEMITRCTTQDFDIAFVDIRMPLVDGISAIRTCLPSCPNTTFIIITGYADFSYAQECIKLGVSDYILKPISPEKLEQLVKACKDKIITHNNKTNNTFSLYTHAILHNFHVNESEDTLAFSDENKAYLCVTLFIDCAINKHLYTKMHSLIASSIKNTFQPMISNDLIYSLDHSLDGNLHVIFYVSQAMKTNILNKLNILIKEFNSESIRTYGLYKEYNTLKEFKENTKDLQRNIRINYNPNNLINLDEVFLPETTLTFFNDLTALINAYESADAAMYHQCINKICRSYTDFPESCNKIHISDFFACVLSLPFECDTFKNFMKTFVMNSDNMYQFIDSDNNTTIDLIIQYINHSFTTDISINSLADKFDLTPNYISRLFHEKTGTKFIDYISELRIKYAKKLLIEKKDVPLKEIAITVGYYSPRHFSNTFKKYASCSPSEYRKKF